MNQKKSMTKNLIYNLIYQFMNILIPMMTVPYLSRVLGPDRIGAYSYAASIVSYFVMFGTFGSSVYGQLLVAKHLYDRRELSIVFKKVVLSRMITFGIVSIGYIFLIVFSKEFRSIYATLTVYLLSQIFDICWFYQGMEMFKITVSRSACTRIISVILIFILVKNENDLLLYILIQQGAVLIANSSLWFDIKKYISYEKVSLTCVINSLKENSIFFIPTIASMVFVSLDKCMIGWMTKSTLENGYYEQANKIYNVLIVLITALTTVILPRIANLRQNNCDSNAVYRLIEKSIRYISLVTFPTSVGLFCVAENFVPVFFGTGYEKCIDLIRVFCVMIIFTSYNSIISTQCLVANGKQKKLNLLLIISSGVNITANLFFIYFFASLGAAIASVISEALLLLLIIFECREEIPFKHWFNYVLRYGSLSLLFGAFEIIIINRNVANGIGKLLIQIVVGIGIYGIGLLITKDKLLFEFLKFRKVKK